MSDLLFRISTCPVERFWPSLHFVDPEAGSLHGPTFRLPHSLLHTNAASASPSTSSTTIGKGREPVLHLSLAEGVASATGELSLAALKQPAFNAYTS